MTLAVRHIRRRRGTTLVLFAVLLFALLPMMALVLDLGIVRVTRRQMQTAANLAASEGLRHLDSTTDQRRREIASDTVQALFDDDLNPNNGDPVGYSAGPKSYLRDDPRTTLPGTSYRIGPRIDTDDNGLPRVTPFDPVLQTNHTENKIHGDLVSGELHSNYGLVATNFVELPAYSRPDQFDAKATTSTERPRAMLARLRRTRLANNDQAPDDEAGVSSAGPPVPYVFGRGGLASGGTPDPNALWNQREAGVTVRATAIADARPALTVGPAILQTLYAGLPATIDGLAPLALHADYWAMLTTGSDIVVFKAGRLESDKGILFGVTSLANAVNDTSTALTVRAVLGWNVAPQTPYLVRIENELMRVTAISPTMSPDEKQWTVERGINATTPLAHDADTRIIRHEVMTIGTAITLPAASSSSAPFDTAALDGFPANETIVPIYDTVGALGDRVIGFGRARITPGTASPNPDEFRISIEALDSIVAAQNASAQLMRALPNDLADPAAVNDLFSRRNDPAVKDRWLLAPALVRTLGKLANSP